MRGASRMRDGYRRADRNDPGMKRLAFFLEAKQSPEPTQRQPARFGLLDRHGRRCGLAMTARTRTVNVFGVWCKSSLQ